MIPQRDSHHAADLFPALAADPYRARLLAYERRKAAWRKAHPQASPEEYEAAMGRICRELGV